MKQSKSLGNYVNAQDEITKYGSDILRLWVSSVNYQEDVRCNDELIGRTQDAYRKIRNTLRYLFGNINDFDPKKDAVPYEQMLEIDKWAMQQLQKLIAEVTEAYEEFTYHRVFSSLYNFCSVEMSSIYMDVLKDRMYCDAPDSLVAPQRPDGDVRGPQRPGADARPDPGAHGRRGLGGDEGQARGLRQRPSGPHAQGRSGHRLRGRRNPNGSSSWRLRDEVLRVLEGLRKDKIIASNQEASITMRCTPEDAAALKEFGLAQFAALCIVSESQARRRRRPDDGDSRPRARTPSASGAGTTGRAWERTRSIRTSASAAPRSCESGRPSIVGWVLNPRVCGI